MIGYRRRLFQVLQPFREKISETLSKDGDAWNSGWIAEEDSGGLL
jgi:hypothetical protein